MTKELKAFVSDSGRGSLFKSGTQIATSYAKCVKAIYVLDDVLAITGEVDYSDAISGFVFDCGAFFFDNIKEISKIQKNGKISDAFDVAAKVLDASGNVYLTLTEKDKLLIVYRYYITIFGLLHTALDGVPDPVTKKVNAGIDIGVQGLKAMVASMELEKAANEKRDEKYDAAFKLYNERASKIWRSYFISFLEIYDDYYFRVADASACTNGTELDLVGVCSPPVIASVSGVSPAVANLSQATTFTITGQNLPLTSVLSIADATCQTPTNRTATGFTVVCTPGGAAESKVVTVKTDTEANGGVVIDASRVVTVQNSPSSYGWNVSTHAQYQYMQLFGISMGSDGSIYGADIHQHSVHKVAKNGIVSAFFNINSGYVDCAYMLNPYSVAVGRDGEVYVADTGYNIIDKLTGVNSKAQTFGYCKYPYGVISYNGVKFNGPVGIAVGPDGSVYTANAGNGDLIERNYIAKIKPDGSTLILAGSNSTGFANGQGVAASFNFESLSGMTVDQNGNIYVADNGNHVVRKISPDGYVATVAGSGVAGFLDGPASIASFKNPTAVAIDSKGNMYVADSGNLKVRMISANGIVSTIAGGGAIVNNETVDGVGGSASFLALFGMTVDKDDNIYVTDAWRKDGGWYWGKIRKISYGIIK